MPVTQIRTYHRPHDLEQAWQLVSAGGGTARLLGGGTDLVISCPPEVRELVDLVDAGLRYITTDGAATVRIGAMATFTDLLEHPALAAHASGVVQDMLREVGSVLHRNSATIGGHIARGRLSDVVPVLLALDAIVVTYAGTSHEQSLRQYYDGPVAPHVVTEVRLPSPPEPTAAAFFRFSRAAFDHALVNCCCRVDLEDTEVAGARVVVGEPAVLGRHLTAAEATLIGQPLTEAAIEAAAAAAQATVETRGDWLVSADFRRHLVGVGVRRCLGAVAERLTGGAR